jgi:ribulose kinase
MEAHGVHIKRVINAGGIPQKNAVLNQVYANVPDVRAGSHGVTSLGSALRFARGGNLQDRGGSTRQDLPASQNL